MLGLSLLEGKYGWMLCLNIFQYLLLLRLLLLLLLLHEECCCVEGADANADADFNADAGCLVTR